MNKDKFTKDHTAVIGVGKAGCSIVSKLPKSTQDIAECFYIHTQEESLIAKGLPNYISIETPETKEFGTNGEAYLGYDCAKYNQEKIISHFFNYQFVIIIAGLGGGTGSGATPYIANILKELGILCVSVVSLPFDFEGDRKKRIALSAYTRVKNSSDSIILVDNNKLLSSQYNISNGLFDLSDKFMSNTIYGLAGLLSRPGLISVDIEDLVSSIKGMGVSTVGFGVSSGKNKATLATEKGMKSTQLFRKFDTKNIKSFLISISGGLDLSMHDFEDVGSVVSVAVSDDANVIIGTMTDTEMIDTIQIVIIASGFEDSIETIALRSSAYAETFRSITFEPEYIQAGISILSYFGEIIKQKYSNLNARVKIERNNNTVTLIVESESGVIEKIDKALDKYGDVVTGFSPASELLGNAIDIERLKMKLEMAAMEIRHNQNIIDLYKKEKNNTDARINNLESEIKKLHNLLGKSLNDTNRIARSAIDLNKTIVQSNINRIEEILEKNHHNKNDEENLIKAIKIIEKTDKSSLSKVYELFSNTIYGITGNAAYDFLGGIINSLPR